MKKVNNLFIEKFAEKATPLYSIDKNIIVSKDKKKLISEVNKIKKLLNLYYLNLNCNSLMSKIDFDVKAGYIDDRLVNYVVFNNLQMTISILNEGIGFPYKYSLNELFLGKNNETYIEFKLIDKTHIDNIPKIFFVKIRDKILEIV